MNLGPRLRELRDAAGLSQSKLAALTGVSRNAVSQWEAGTTQPSTRRLGNLARVLNVQIDQLMSATSEKRERLVETANRLFSRLNADDVSVEVICATADISKMEFNTLFRTKEDLLYEAIRAHTERKYAEIRRMPPRYGSLAAQIKYLLRLYYVVDLASLKLVAAEQAYSWQWSEIRERDDARQLFEHHELVNALFNEAAARGQIRQGNFRAASALILAAYKQGLRKALFEQCDVDRLINFIEPQIRIILDGFGFREIPGFGDDGAMLKD